MQREASLKGLGAGQRIVLIKVAQCLFRVRAEQKDGF
jgi:hypothetical protein